ncbi:MAG: hypothetical protein FIA95_15390 [Gemmatimonadetes bacterium]|nr:hypothetical protein [Gemmatimonadota bacterium]
MASRSKRDQGWAANGKLSGLPKKSAMITGNTPNNITGISDKEVGMFLDWLHQWAQDMHAWGQNVRDDIVRLEGHAGFATGDPGDPPDGPPDDD